MWAFIEGFAFVEFAVFVEIVVCWISSRIFERILFRVFVIIKGFYFYDRLPYTFRGLFIFIYPPVKSHVSPTCRPTFAHSSRKNLKQDNVDKTKVIYLHVNFHNSLNTIGKIEECTASIYRLFERQIGNNFRLLRIVVDLSLESLKSSDSNFKLMFVFRCRR